MNKLPDWLRNGVENQKQTIIDDMKTYADKLGVSVHTLGGVILGDLPFFSKLSNNQRCESRIKTLDKLYGGMKNWGKWRVTIKYNDGLVSHWYYTKKAYAYRKAEDVRQLKLGTAEVKELNV